MIIVQLLKKVTDTNKGNLKKLSRFSFFDVFVKELCYGR